MPAARAPTMRAMLTSRLAAHPRRTLIAVLLFVVLAGALGGPVAGALESSGGFVAPGADSEVAVERIEAATGTEPGPASCCSSTILRRSGSPPIERELANVPGVASTAPGGRAGDDALVTATLRAAPTRTRSPSARSTCSPAPTA